METQETLSQNPESQILDLVRDKDTLDWKSFLYQILHKEGLDPFDIDISVLTHRYLDTLKELQQVDFTLSGKFLTIAVFLLKEKATRLMDTDLRGMEDKFNELQDTSHELEDNLDHLEDFNSDLDGLFESQEEQQPRRDKYSLKVRNPLARKRKVNIFDLIKTLEKTFQQSNKRRVNFFLRNQDVDYEGPVYEKKKKDLKVVIEELFEHISQEFNSKKGHVTFSHLTRDVSHKEGILDKFVPLLHLHNQTRIELKQQGHFGDIEIHPSRE